MHHTFQVVDGDQQRESTSEAIASAAASDGARGTGSSGTSGPDVVAMDADDLV